MGNKRGTFLALLVLVSTVLSGCKESPPDPVPGMESLAGKWQAVAQQRAENEELVWVELLDEPLVSFRFDGVMVNEKGLGACCVPNVYLINGNEFTVSPRVEVPVNPQCHLIDCFTCEYLDISIDGDEMLITYCREPYIQRKYRRVS